MDYADLLKLKKEYELSLGLLNYSLDLQKEIKEIG